MLAFDADDQELELFLAETNDHLQSLDQCIVQLETNAEDGQILQQIFRSAHTIKGGAGMIGHQRMAELAHGMENVLDAMRSRTLLVTPDIINNLLAALDALRVLSGEVATRNPSPIVLEGIHEALAACLSSTRPAPVAAPAIHESETGEMEDWPLDEALERELAAVAPTPAYVITASVDPDSGLVAARLLQVLLEVERGTHVLQARPSMAEIEAEAGTATLRALVTSDQLPSMLEMSLASIVDIVAVRVAPLASRERAAEQVKVSVPGTGLETVRATVDKPAQVDTTIRISVSIVDSLMSLVSELVLGRTRLQTLRAQLQERYASDDAVANLEDAVGHLDQVSNDLQATVMKARMLPVENVFNKFPRLVRDLAAHVGKQVTFSMQGTETELDRSVIEQLSDPLVHLLRNAIDHGIEPPEERLAAGKAASGCISISATPCENHILIEVRDDGHGIDGAKMAAKAVAKGMISPEVAERFSEREAVDLIFLPGLSTAREVTDISGRGVGMDIVKSALERMGGRISIASSVGAGTTFSITLPLTLAIMQALLVSVSDAVYALPLNLVTEIISVPDKEIHWLQGTEATVLRGTILPLVRLRQCFGCAEARSGTGQNQIVAVRVDGQVLGLVVDRFIGEQEIVMKPLGTYMGMVPGLAGATILGDGRIGLLVDALALKNWSPARPLAAAS